MLPIITEGRHGKGEGRGEDERGRLVMKGHEQWVMMAVGEGLGMNGESLDVKGGKDGEERGKLVLVG